MEIEEKLAKIKDWLGEGSVNIFGMPMSGKDTQGVHLAEKIGGKFLSSGLIVRTMEAEMDTPSITATGQLLPTNLFFEWVLPYFERRDLWGYPLVLSSIGRWIGEETQVMSVAEGAGHPLKVVVYLELTEEEIRRRWETAKELKDRGERADDVDLDVFRKRITEFKEKTVPVLKKYEDMGMLIFVNGAQTREEVFKEMVDKIYKFSLEN